MGLFDWFRRKDQAVQTVKANHIGAVTEMVKPDHPEQPLEMVRPVAKVTDPISKKAPTLITLDQLRRGLGISREMADKWDDWLNEAMFLWGIKERLDVACFLAQVGHESAGLRYSKEIWGNTRAQLRYEGRRDLGNTVKGDGKRFMGRGPIQITGRANYRKVTQWIRKVVPDAPDFEAKPHLLELPRWGSLAAGAFWKWNNLSELGRQGAITKITRIVNGGYNGLADRKKRFNQLLNVL